MKLRASCLVVAGAALFGWAMYEVGASCPRRHRLVAQATPAQAQPAQTGKTEKGQKSEAKQDADKEAILANVKTFTEAFNRRDVMALLKLFTEDCELTESDGTVVHGLEELE